MTTQNQAIIGAILERLNLVPVPNTSGIMGAEHKYEVKQETIDFLNSKKGKILVISSSGELSFEDSDS